MNDAVRHLVKLSFRATSQRFFAIFSSVCRAVTVWKSTLIYSIRFKKGSILKSSNIVPLAFNYSKI